VSRRSGAELADLAAAISYPRRAGSEGSRRAVAWLSARLEELGLEVHVEDFSYDLRPVERVLRWALLAGGMLVAAAGWMATRYPWSALLIVAFILAGGGMFLGWSPWLEELYRRGGPTRTANVVGRRRAVEPRRRLILMAHHDSKSQSLILPVRMAATIGALAGPIGVVIAIATAGRWEGAGWLGLAAGTAGLVAMTALALMTSGNESPGGVDNAGSVAIVLELVSRLSDLPADFELVALLTGAEEDHMVGAMRFLDAHEDELALRPAWCLNFDGAGSPGRTVLITRYGRGRRFAPAMERIAVKTASEIGLPIRRIVMAPAVGIDAIPFAHRGIECLTLSSGSLGRATYAVHSAGDVVENLDGETMGRIVDYAEAIVERLRRA
jgi:acetylornithine deacetylase/succinyl-diaminopimelate desuccinylase-like protein